MGDCGLKQDPILLDTETLVSRTAQIGVAALPEVVRHKSTGRRSHIAVLEGLHYVVLVGYRDFTGT